MAIDRTAFDALVDDDGSNLVGSPITKSLVETVLLDPIDDAIADAVSGITSARVPPMVVASASSATPTPDADAADVFTLTAQAAAAAFVNPTGTPTNGQKLLIRILDNGTARAITWGTAYVPAGADLPTTTIPSKLLTLGFIYNTDNGLNKWQLVAAAQEA